MIHKSQGTLADQHEFLTKWASIATIQHRCSSSQSPWQCKSLRMKQNGAEFAWLSAFCRYSDHGGLTTIGKVSQMLTIMGSYSQPHLASSNRLLSAIPDMLRFVTLATGRRI